ncbi:MAG: AraC family transcriptional regulator [Ruminococcaceae bacterium]|nr:AraC family transcriptional regulator [Oscillospiraceae bacterium]
MSVKIKKYIRNYTDIPTALFCHHEEDLAPGARFGPVIRDVYIFECCTEGKGSVIINEREFAIRKGDFYVLFPGDAVTHTADEVHPRAGYSCVALGLSLHHTLARAGITSEKPFASRKLFPVLAREMKKMHEIDAETDPGTESRRTACLYRILGELLRLAPETDRNELVQKAVGIMETRYHEDLTVESLSREVGLERSYFTTFFKEKTGIPPHRYLTRLRVQKACDLMTRRDLSVTEAAESVGLDPQNFSRLFKKEMGMTPSQYKQK